LFNPLGELVVGAAANEEVVMIGDVDPGLVARVRADYPFLDERTDS
jgi:predicted amidohydrolase